MAESALEPKSDSRTYALITPLPPTSRKGAKSLISKPFLHPSSNPPASSSSCSVPHDAGLRGLDTQEEKRKERVDDSKRLQTVREFGKRGPDFCKGGEK